MNAMMNETLNIGGALLVKLFGRREVEVSRRPAGGSGARPRRAARRAGDHLLCDHWPVERCGHGLVYGIGGYLVIRGAFTVGQIVQFGAYLTSLYMALRDWPTRRWSSPPRWSASSGSSKSSTCPMISRSSRTPESSATCAASWYSRMSPSVTWSTTAFCSATCSVLAPCIGYRRPLGNGGKKAGEQGSGDKERRLGAGSRGSKANVPPTP